MIAWVLRNVGYREGIIGGLVVCLLWCGSMWFRAAVELKEAKLVYKNPEIKTVERVVYRVGPVRIKTVVVKEKDGDQITTIEEEHGENTTTTDNSKETTVVPLSVALAPPRTDRYLLSAGFNRLSSDFDGKALFVGYGWKNRFDVQVGAVRHDGTTPWVLATLRF